MTHPFVGLVQSMVPTEPWGELLPFDVPTALPMTTTATAVPTAAQNHHFL